MVESADEVETQRLTGRANMSDKHAPLGLMGLRLASVSTHILALALLVSLAMTLKTYLSPDKPLLKWRTFPLHSFLMVLAFGFLSPIGAAAWRSYETVLGVSHGAVKVVHGVLMTSALVVGTLGVINMWLVHEDGAAAQIAKGWSVHFQSAHSYVGFAVLLMFAAQALGGTTAFVLPTTGSARRARLVEPHRIFGMLSAQQAAMIAIITGILSLAGRGDNVADKDLAFKAAAMLALALAVALGLVLRR